MGIYGIIISTEDGGETWEKLSSGTGATLYGIAFLNEDSAFAVGTGGMIYRTTDGGDRWFRWPSGTGDDLFVVSFLDDSKGLIVGEETALITEDGGETWTRLALPPKARLTGAQYIAPDVMTAVGRYGTIIRAERAAD